MECSLCLVLSWSFTCDWLIGSGLAVGYAMLNRLFPEDGGNIVQHPRQLNNEPLRMLISKDDPQSVKLLRVFNARLRDFARRGDLQRLQQALNSGNADDWKPSTSAHAGRN